MTANLFWRFPLRYGLHRMISVVKTDSTITARVPHRHRDHTACCPPPIPLHTHTHTLPSPLQYDGCIFSQRECYIQKPCAVGISNGTKRYIFNILTIYIDIGSDDKHSPYIYITQHQSTPTRTATWIQVRTRRHTNTFHIFVRLGGKKKKKKKISHQSEAANYWSCADCSADTSQDAPVGHEGPYNFFFCLHSMNFSRVSFFFEAYCCLWVL